MNNLEQSEKKLYSSEIIRLKDALKSADAVVIGAGALNRSGLTRYKPKIVEAIINSLSE